MYYMVVDLNNTKDKENDFDLEYHHKYLGKAGEEINHAHKTGDFKDFICLKFKNQEADWFHKDDLIEVVI